MISVIMILLIGSSQLDLVQFLNLICWRGRVPELYLTCELFQTRIFSHGSSPLSRHMSHCCKRPLQDFKNTRRSESVRTFCILQPTTVLFLVGAMSSDRGRPFYRFDLNSRPGESGLLNRFQANLCRYQAPTSASASGPSRR